ncbi:MAG: DUF1553 domain-containing protein [Verrucomicrobiota bacterium]
MENCWEKKGVFVGSLVGLMLVSGRVSGEVDPLDFNDDVQPILSEYCFHCHGPDSSTRAPKSQPLRLDIEEEAFSIRKSTGEPAILKGNAEDSLIYQRMILPADDEELMPPKKAHKTMKPEEIAIIKRWIEEGAVYEDHWAFVAPVKPELPEVSESAKDWVRNGIDHFVAAAHAEEGLQPNEEEEGTRLARRIAFDLTGLPPEVEEVEKWSADPDQVVEELMGTDEYAEHFARHWLDAARYGDTHGIHIDNFRSIWPYRDWVISAFKENMPFDQFTREQVAGDLLPDASLEQQVASGFNRCLPTTGEGGAIKEEWEAIYAQDRVDTVAAIWLGLTTGCAACHDHKFDPISAKDNYSLTAFFRNSTMQAMDFNLPDHPPNLLVPKKEDREDWKLVKAEVEALKNHLNQRRQTGKSDFVAWSKDVKAEELKPNEEGLELHLPLNEWGGQIQIRTAKGKRSLHSDRLQRRPGMYGRAPLLERTEVELGKDFGNVDSGDAITLSAQVYIEGRPRGPLIAKMDEGNGHRGWDLWLENGFIGAHFIDQWPKKGFKTLTKKQIIPKRWTHVVVTYDPKRGKRERLQIYVDGKQVESRSLTATGGEDFLNEVPLKLGGRSGKTQIVGGVAAMQEFRLYRRVLSDHEIAQVGNSVDLEEGLKKPESERSGRQKKALRDYFFTRIDAPSQKVLADYGKVERRFEEIRERGAVTLVMDEKEGEPYAHILTRGDYRQKAEKVSPAVPEFLPPMDESLPRNRLGLAEWLVDEGNPLSARVTVNRMWYYFFGEGLVETTEDFGVMGARPTHPELLDWLAMEFVDSGWDFQHVIRLIVDSATYRQSGVMEERHLELDPKNKFLTRGPRYRMDAEQIRDLALKASGLLVPKVGGPSVKPYQPDGVWEAVAMKQSNTRFYRQDEGENLYRRSMYSFWKRTAPPASLDIFDAPSRESFCVRRERTNTPLQAFVLMNDPQFVEASRKLAERVMREEEGLEGRVRLIYLALVGREPESEEVRIVGESYEVMKAGFEAEPGRAEELLGVGASGRDEGLNVVELAAWTMVATQVLNLDETITK